MSFNGSGTFNINSAGQPVVSGTVISSSTFNTLTADLATGLSTCITKDGQTTVTANIPMNSYKITGLAAGTAATDAARVGQLQAGAASVVTAAGTDTYTGTMSPSLGAYAAGNTFTFVVPNTNTTAATLNIDGLGAKALTRDGSTALVAGDLVANAEVLVVYDGTRFQVLNSNSKTNFNLSGTLTVAGNTTLSGGTANQVQYLNGSKVLTGSSNLTFDGTTLTANALTTTSTVTVNGGTANGVAYLNASKVLTTGSALTWNGSTFFANGTIQQGNGGAATIGKIWNDSGLYSVQADYTNVNGLKLDSPAYTVFTLNNAEQMRLTSTGLGIGTSSPSQKLNVATASGNAYMRVERASQATGQVGLQIGGGTSSTDWLMYVPASSNTLTWFGNSATLMSLDTSGNLGIGTSSPGYRLQVTNTAASNFVSVVSVNTGTAGLLLGDTDSATVGRVEYENLNNAMTFYTNGSERARIDSSGNLLVGTTSTSPASSNVAGFAVNNSGYISLTGNGTSAIDCNRTNDGIIQAFRQGGTLVGSVSVTTLLTSYNTTSDYRLKEFIAPVTGAGERIDALNPVEFDWKSDGSRARGFFAHEFQQVYANSVTGTKDAVDEDGKPVYQAMQASTSEVIADLVAEIKSLRVRLNALENK
jgi:hypothetical protein